MTRRAGETGRNRPAATEARKAKAIPLLAEGRSYDEIARAVGVTHRTVRRWVDEDPAFAEAVARVRAKASEAVEEAADHIKGIVTASLDRLAVLLRSEDERIALEAVKTALDRFGHPVRKEERAEVEHRGAGLVVALTRDEVRRAARMKEEG